MDYNNSCIHNKQGASQEAWEIVSIWLTSMQRLPWRLWTGVWEKSSCAAVRGCWLVWWICGVPKEGCFKRRPTLGILNPSTVVRVLDLFRGLVVVDCRYKISICQNTCCTWIHPLLWLSVWSPTFFGNMVHCWQLLKNLVHFPTNHNWISDWHSMSEMN